jgi:CopA family copper-resistance protein
MAVPRLSAACLVAVMLGLIVWAVGGPDWARRAAGWALLLYVALELRGVGASGRFVLSAALAGTLAALPFPLRQALAATRAAPILEGRDFALEIGPVPVNMTGRARMAIGINGQVPAPILRWREGDTVTLAVTNRLPETSSIHWHGILLPTEMDGVPGLSFNGIAPGETFVYRFPVRQSGTFWYHSHSGFQEQSGLYGSIVIEPRAGYAQNFDRDYVVLLSDWSDEAPETIVSNLKFQSDYYNFGQRTVGTFFADARDKGLASTVSDRIEWGKMRMTPTDILDVSGATYTYLVNGKPPAANWTGLFRPGERVRLRFINGSAMSIFDVRIPGLKLSVVQADGNDVEPVSVDELRIGTAETYDVIVTPPAAEAYTIFAQAADRSGYARGTLAPRAGMGGVIPPLDPRPLRTMADMGMDHGAMSGMSGMSGMDHSTMPGMQQPGGGATAGMQHGGSAIAGMPPMPGMDHSAMSGMDHGAMSGMSGMDHSKMPGMQQPGGGAKAGMQHGGSTMAGMPPMPGMDHSAMSGMSGMDHSKMPGANTGGAMPMNHGAMPMTGAAPDLNTGVETDNVAMMPKDRLGEAGIGLDDNGRRVLRYTDLRAIKRGADARPPSREIVLHLTGNMQRFIWGFDGRKFSEAERIHLSYGERVRIVLVNDTMMEHPIHLHGLWSELENGASDYRPYKHTILTKPGERLSFLVTADARGRWAFHCHLLYHMEMGMFREVHVS